MLDTQQKMSKKLAENKKLHLGLGKNRKNNYPEIKIVCKTFKQKNFYAFQANERSLQYGGKKRRTVKFITIDNVY